MPSTLERSGKSSGPRALVLFVGLSVVAPASGQDDRLGDDAAAVEGDATMASLAAVISTARAKQQVLAAQAAGITAQSAQARHELGTHVRALYRITHPGLSPALGGMTAVLRHVGRVKRLKRIVAHDVQALQAVERRATDLRVETGRVADELDQAQLRLAALKAAAREGSNSEREPSHYGLRIVDGPAMSNFENERGRLSSPVAGDVRIVEARVAESEGPGLQFQAPRGTPVRAVAPGRVAFADRYGGYGQLVILEHGAGYYTAYGGLGALDVRVGDDLLRHARIGDVGTEFSPPALFFEVRRGSRTLDPGSWLGYR